METRRSKLWQTKSLNTSTSMSDDSSASSSSAESVTYLEKEEEEGNSNTNIHILDESQSHQDDSRHKISSTSSHKNHPTTLLTNTLSIPTKNNVKTHLSSATTTISTSDNNHERQILILMLLAQVCALHDSTPKTFIVHVLSLYEKGILDYENIGFLFDLGLVPKPTTSSSNLTTIISTARQQDSPLCQSHDDHYHDNSADHDNDNHNDFSNSNLVMQPTTDGNTTKLTWELEKNNPNPLKTTEDERNKSDASQDKDNAVIIDHYDKNKTNTTTALITFRSQDNTPSLSPSNATTQNHASCNRYNQDKSNSNHDTSTTLDLATIQRVNQVMAIREHLERHESISESINDTQQNDNINNTTKQYTRTQSNISSASTSTTTSWSVENHPLSLSRFKRDFIQGAMLASGSFGQVFRATNKLDGVDYAMKRVAFSAQGYDTKQVELVIREVQCLAQLGHENVVRYYTSWLEPSWMTGSASTAPRHVRKQLLMDLHKLVLNEKGTTPDIYELDSFGDEVWNSMDHDANDYSDQRWYQSNHTSYSEDGQSEYSEWSYDESRNNFLGYDKSDNHKCNYSSSRNFTAIDNLNQSTKYKQRRMNTTTSRQDFRYQICLFIQMELCHPTTLADWIKERKVPKTISEKHDFYNTAWDIFCQIIRGLTHVHSKGVIHRDLKPANIFMGDDGLFKIGDFGLSKLIQSANTGGRKKLNVFGEQEIYTSTNLLPTKSNHTNTGFDENNGANGWEEHLTAGIGTASYAAPEQIASKTYDSAADIFSLGLILLELISNFGSEHERAKTFQNCRNGKLPKWLETTDVFELKRLGQLILACTAQNPTDRPMAKNLIRLEAFQEMEMKAEIEKLQMEVRLRDSKIEDLQKQLLEKEQELLRMKEYIARKVDIITDDDDDLKNHDTCTNAVDIYSSESSCDY